MTAITKGDYMEELLTDCKPHLKEIVKIVVLKHAKAALQKAVAESETKIDDMALEALLPGFEAAFISFIEKA